MKEFKEWLRKNYHLVMVKTIRENEEISDHLEYFEWLFPFEFKWGVYLKFFDEKGIPICCEPLPFGSYHYMIHGSKEYSTTQFQTRQEAQQEAIKKAFEILEKKD